MSVNIDKLVKELENIYENSCFYKAIQNGNDKCLALDEQELAIIYMCIETLAMNEGLDINNYETRGLFIVPKNRSLITSVCSDNRVKNQPLKFKKFEYASNFQLEQMTQYFFVYYAVIIFYANDENTGDYNEEVRRHYAKVYAYFACLCSKIFFTLFLNEIYIFMSKVNSQLPYKELYEYLEYTEELWEEYNALLKNKRSVEISEKVIDEFCEIMSCDEKALFRSWITIENLREDVFLAFDYMQGDTISSYRFKKILMGIEYFQDFLRCLKKDIEKNTFREETLLKKIDNILEYAKQLKLIFEDLLKQKKAQPYQYDEEFDNTYRLLALFRDSFRLDVNLITP